MLHFGLGHHNIYALQRGTIFNNILTYESQTARDIYARYAGAALEGTDSESFESAWQCNAACQAAARAERVIAQFL